MKNRTSILTSAALLAALAGTGAQAASGEVPFNGAVTNTCVLQAATPGTMVSSGDAKTLSSRTAEGGVSGSVQVLATGPLFKVTTTAPAGFTAGPADRNTNTSFETFYSLNGVTTLDQVAGTTESSVSVGITNMLVDLKATKTSGIFSAGADYKALVTVTCE